MRHRAVALWGGLLMLGATALMGAVLLVSGPAAATAPYGPTGNAPTNCLTSQVVQVGSTYTLNLSCAFAAGSTITITLNGGFYLSLTAPPSGVFSAVVVVTDPHISLNGGPAVAAAPGSTTTFVATGVNASGAKNIATIVITLPPVTSPAAATPAAAPAPSPSTTSPSVAFTGAELALLVTIGAIAIGVGGMLVLISRRRRSRPAYGEMDVVGRNQWTWPKQQ